MSIQSEENRKKVAIITGGSRGIGQRIAERLAQAGYAVVINYRNEIAKADEVVTGITKAGGAAKAVKGDVADEAAMAKLFETAEREFGGVDVVVHAAGILTVTPLADFDVKRMDEILNTNLRGTLIVNQQAARKVRSGGAIINISSAITNNLAPGYSVYAATKAGLEALTKVLAKELGGKNITVNTVAPGPTETEMLLNDLENSGHGEQMRQGIIDMTALKRIGKPDDIAEMILALAGPIRWVTGQTIHTSGGIAI